MQETLTGFNPASLPENFPTDYNQAFDRWCELRASYTNLPPEDRFAPPTESHNLNSEAYLKDVARLQRFFNNGLKIANATRVILNYNPVLERAVYEHLETEDQKKQFKLYEITQIEKALRERYNVATSTVIYDIDENSKLRSRDLPNQAFEDVLETGIEYYKSLSSPDVSRMEQERAGFLKIQEVFTAPGSSVDLKAEVVSGPGLVKGTIFTDNFLDRYELLEESFTGRRIVQMTRFTTDTTYEQYEQRISASKPDYFEDFSGPKDEWFLKNPLFESNGEILVQRKTALKEQDFRKIVKENITMMDHLVDVICQGIPEKIVVALNALLNGADYIWERVLNPISKVTEKIMPFFKTVSDKVNWFGHQVVREVAAGCGLSGGFSLGGGMERVKSRFSKGIKRVGRAIRNLLGLRSKDPNYCENCPVCGEAIDDVIKAGDKCPHCHTKKQCG